MSELRLPLERGRHFDFLLNQFRHDVATVDVDRADGVHFLSLTSGQVSQQQIDELVQLHYLWGTKTHYVKNIRGSGVREIIIYLGLETRSSENLVPGK